jgi:hypothetical protein
VNEPSDTARDRPPVTLQISLSPGDLRFAKEIVPHQLRMWQGQFDDALLTLDLHRTEGHYGRGWEEGRGKIEGVLDQIAASDPAARVVQVDYSPAAAAEVSDAFFGGKKAPPKAHTGAPLYPYYWGLLAARHDHVFHVDSDILFGGGSKTWMREATDLLEKRSDVIFCNPLAGPPTLDGEIPPRVVERMLRWGGAVPEREPAPWPAFRLDTVSSRLFFVNRRTLAQRLGPIPLRRPSLGQGRARASTTTTLRHLVTARLRGRQHVELPEEALSARMRERGQLRIDLLGTAPGMWTLHPTDRSESFFSGLPRLIERVEAGEIPDDQRGDYNLTDSMLPGSAATSDVRR